MRNLLLFLLLGTTLLASAQGPCNVGIASTPVTCFGGNDGTATITLPTGGNYAYNWQPGGNTNNPTTGLTAGTYTCTVLGVGTGGGPVTTFYTETFDNAAQTWVLNTATGINDAQANLWVISDAEGGQIPPNCGIASNGNKTLHVTATGGGNLGAAYNAGGLCAIGVCVVTNKRAESTNISTMGYTNLNLKFDYIGNGEGLDDNCRLVYSVNGAAGPWTVLNPSLKSNVCPPPNNQGQWTAYNIALPAACQNITTLRIGFEWTNDDDGLGTDPSFAVNNVTIEGNQSTGCQSVLTTTITQPTQMQSTATVNAAGCGGIASINLSVTGGVPGYQYLWSTGDTTANITNVSSGTHICTITDNNGCVDTVTAVVPTSGNAPQVGLTAQAANCGFTNGSATATVAGGTPPYSFSWSPSGGTNPGATGLAPGVYTCTVTDNNGCSGVQSVTVNSLSSILVNVNYTSPTCAESQDGSITVAPLGGTAPFTYSWNTGFFSPTLPNVGPGTYSCYIIDANGCDVVSLTTLTAGPPIVLNSMAGPSTATVTASGGNPPYVYSWMTSPTQTTATASGLTPGVYQVYVTDANGCTKTITVTVTEGSTGIDYEALGIYELKIYPNPVGNALSIELVPNQIENVNITLLDLTQREISRQSFSNTSNVSTQLDVQNLTDGVYLLHIETSKGKAVEKIVVSH
ncbi:MAG: T9SS type A sorting domain-containing protein [Bacteroidia bacterium]